MFSSIKDSCLDNSLYFSVIYLMSSISPLRVIDSLMFPLLLSVLYGFLSDYSDGGNFKKWDSNEFIFLIYLNFILVLIERFSIDILKSFKLSSFEYNRLSIS